MLQIIFPVMFVYSVGKLMTSYLLNDVTYICVKLTMEPKV